MSLPARVETALRRGWNCRLTTQGRTSGKPRTVTIWYAHDGDFVYLTGGSTDPHWVRNIRQCADVELEIGGQRLSGRAEVVDAPDAADAIRQRFVDRYLAARFARAIGTGYTDSVAVSVAVEPASG